LYLGKQLLFILETKDSKYTLFAQYLVAESYGRLVHHLGKVLPNFILMGYIYFEVMDHGILN
jgi:hypothetical protein